MPKPYGISFFCEDIRHEVGGKVSYMGIFGQDMEIEGSKPAVLPRFTIAVHLHIPVSYAPTNLRVVVLMVANSGTKELMALEGPLEATAPHPAGDDHYIVANIHLNAIPFQVDEDCVLRVRAYCRDEEVKLGSFNIRFVEPEALEASMAPEANWQS